MIRNIQNLPGAGQTGQAGQAVRKGWKGADFGSMLQRQMRENQTARPENGFEDVAARAAAEAGQAAAIRQAMGIGGVPGTASGMGAVPAVGTSSGMGAVPAVGTASGMGAVSPVGTASGAGAAPPAGTATDVRNPAAVPYADAADSPARQTVNFSKHALARAEERGIELTDTLLDKLADSVERAQEKGAKNILAFDNTRAFIINIPYSRVITAISQEEMRENIFTNIDGAVLL